MGEVELTRILLEQHKATQLELKRNRRATRALTKEVKAMNESNVKVAKAFEDVKTAVVQTTPDALAKIAAGFRLMVGVITLHLFVSPILGSEAVKVWISAMLRRAVGLAL